MIGPVLITGATSGLGLAAAVHFVNLGASSVIITARSAVKGEAAKTSIETQTGTARKGIVRVILLEMSTLASTKTFADNVKREVKRIDYLLLNAGMLDTAFRSGEEGFEETIQVNVLSTALLAILLLPWLKNAGGGNAHLGVVISGLHRGVDVHTWPQNDVLGFFSKSDKWPKVSMYATSKLLAQYVMNEIAKMAVGSDGKAEVIVNPMCPGMVESDLSRQYKKRVLTSFGADMILNVIAKSTERWFSLLWRGRMESTLLISSETPVLHRWKEVRTLYNQRPTVCSAAEKTVFGPEGQKMQAEVSKEVLAVLEK